jgi:hypothetical protein
MVLTVGILYTTRCVGSGLWSYRVDGWHTVYKQVLNLGQVSVCLYITWRTYRYPILIPNIYHTNKGPEASLITPGREWTRIRFPHDLQL